MFKKTPHYSRTRLFLALCLQSKKTREESLTTVRMVTGSSTANGTVSGDLGGLAEKGLLHPSPLLLARHKPLGDETFWVADGCSGRSGNLSGKSKSSLPTRRFRPYSAEQRVRAELPQGSRLPSSSGAWLDAVPPPLRRTAKHSPAA